MTPVAVGSMLVGAAAGLGIMAVLAFALYSLLDGWRSGALAAGIYLAVGVILAVIGWIVLAGAR